MQRFDKERSVIFKQFSNVPAALNDKEEMALIDVMVCACQQAATGHGPPGRTIRKSKEKRSTVIDKKDLSGHFMKLLPALLNKVKRRDTISHIL